MGHAISLGQTVHTKTGLVGRAVELREKSLKMEIIDKKTKGTRIVIKKYTQLKEWED